MVMMCYVVIYVIIMYYVEGGGGGAVVVGHTHRQRVSTTFFDSEKLTLYFLVRAPDGIRTSVLCIWRPTLYQLATPVSTINVLLCH